MSRIDRYLTELERSFEATGDIAHWPVHMGEALAYCSDMEGSDIFQRFQRLRAEGASPATVGSLFVTTSSARTLLPELVHGMKIAGIPAEERVELTEFFFDIWATQEATGEFLPNGRHRTLPEEAVQRLLGRRGWILVDDDAGRELARQAFCLSAGAKSLVFALYFYGWTDIGFVTHGPYDVVDQHGAEATLLARDFVDLRPEALWPHMTASPATVRLLTLHPPELDLTVDLFNHVRTSSSLAASARAVHLTVDGRTLTEPDEIAPAAAVVLDQIRRQQQVLDALERIEVVAKFVESRYYAFRRWRQRFGDDWRPPGEVTDRLRTWDPVIIGEDSGVDIPALIDAFDPRSETFLA